MRRATRPRSNAGRLTSGDASVSDDRTPSSVLIVDERSELRGRSSLRVVAVRFHRRAYLTDLLNRVDEVVQLVDDFGCDAGRTDDSLPSHHLDTFDACLLECWNRR